MFVGFWTAPFRDMPFKAVVKFASENGFEGLDVVTGVGHGHIDAEKVRKDKGRSVKRLLKENWFMTNLQGLHHFERLF